MIVFVQEPKSHIKIIIKIKKLVMENARYNVNIKYQLYFYTLAVKRMPISFICNNI